MSANAYLGAFPIAAALSAGADIVVTGRCVDSAVTLGPLIHAFGWSATDYDRLAQGSLAGHLIECGTQTTGGNYTDWESVPGWDDMGFPIAGATAAASSSPNPKAPKRLVCPSTVGEQMLYEIRRPARLHPARHRATSRASRSRSSAPTRSRSRAHAARTTDQAEVGVRCCRRPRHGLVHDRRHRRRPQGAPRGRGHACAPAAISPAAAGPAFSKPASKP